LNSAPPTSTGDPASVLNKGVNLWIGVARRKQWPRVSAGTAGFAAAQRDLQTVYKRVEFCSRPIGISECVPI
jgi:hypothetical protein